MPRIKRKRLAFTVESLNELYQECYNDHYNFKAQINSFLNKWSQLIKEDHHVVTMGKEIVSLINSLGKTNDQKLVLLKLLKEVVMNKNEKASDKKSDGQITMSEEAKNELMKMAEEARRGIENS